MRYKNDKKYQICHHHIRFFKLKMHQNPFSARAEPRTPLGELTTLPRPPSRLGRGIHPPHSPPRSTPSASRTRRLRRLGSQAPSTQNPSYASDQIAELENGRVGKPSHFHASEHLPAYTIGSVIFIVLHFPLGSWKWVFSEACCPCRGPTNSVMH